MGSGFTAGQDPDRGQKTRWDQAYLEARASNTPAQALYRKLGFIPIGVQKDYYADTGEDAVIMLLSPIDSQALAKWVIHQ